VIRLNPEPQISGTVVDLDRRPVSTMPIYLLNAQPTVNVDGDKRFRVVSETITDEKGHYVLQKITAGRYYVAAGGPGRPAGMVRISGPTTPGGERITERIPTLQPQPYTYYPGVPDVTLAGQVQLPAGIKVELGDLVLTKPMLRSIRGRVEDYTTGKPPKSVRVTLTKLSTFVRAGAASTEILSTVKYDQTTGLFEATNLIPGIYRVDAVLPPQQTSTPQPIVVTLGGVSSQSAFEILELGNADVQDLVLVPTSSRVTGKVVVADGKPFPVAESNLPIPFQLMLRPLSPLQPAPVVTSVSLVDGTFEVASRLEGKYRFFLGPLRDNYYLSEARLNGVPTTNGILDIAKGPTTELVFTLDAGGAVQGSVVDKNGRPVKQAQGLLLPDPLPETIPFYELLDADASGSFIANGVPPGNYKVYSWEGIAPAQFFDRELLLRSGAHASKVHVEKGSHATVSVPIIVP
jgi:hypothetical protein